MIIRCDKPTDHFLTDEQLDVEHFDWFCRRCWPNLEDDEEEE